MPWSRPPAPGPAISRAVPRRDRRQTVSAQAHVDARLAVLGPLEEVRDHPEAGFQDLVPRRRATEFSPSLLADGGRLRPGTGHLEAEWLRRLKIPQVDRLRPPKWSAVYWRCSAMTGCRPRSKRKQVFQSSRSYRPLVLAFLPRAIANRGPPSTCSHSTLMGSSTPTDRQGIGDRNSSPPGRTHGPDRG